MIFGVQFSFNDFKLGRPTNSCVSLIDGIPFWGAKGTKMDKFWTLCEKQFQMSYTLSAIVELGSFNMQGHVLWGGVGGGPLSGTSRVKQ